MAGTVLTAYLKARAFYIRPTVELFFSHLSTFLVISVNPEANSQKFRRRYSCPNIEILIFSSFFDIFVVAREDSNNSPQPDSLS